MLTCAALLTCYDKYCGYTGNELDKYRQQLHKAERLIDDKTCKLRQSDNNFTQLITLLDAIKLRLKDDNDQLKDRACNMEKSLQAAQKSNHQLENDLSRAQNRLFVKNAMLIEKESIKVELLGKVDSLTAELATQKADYEKLNKAQLSHFQTSSTKLEDHVEKLNKYKDAVECKICFETQVDVVWQCGHVTCRGCAEVVPLRQCPRHGHVRRYCPHCRQFGGFSRLFLG